MLFVWYNVRTGTPQHVLDKINNLQPKTYSTGGKKVKPLPSSVTVILPGSAGKRASTRQVQLPPSDGAATGADGGSSPISRRSSARAVSGGGGASRNVDGIGSIDEVESFVQDDCSDVDLGELDNSQQERPTFEEVSVCQ